MWHRRRVTSFAWTRRAHDVPVVVRNLPALLGETLEDRTLLSGVTDTAVKQSSWSVLLGTETSLSFVLPVDSVLGLLASDISQTANRLAGEPFGEGHDLTSLQFRADAQSDWRNFMKFSPDADSATTEGAQVLVTVEFASANFADEAMRFVTISLEFLSDATLINGGAVATDESRFNLASNAEAATPDESLPMLSLSTTSALSVGLQSIAGVGTAISPSPGASPVTEQEDGLDSVRYLPLSSPEFVGQPTVRFEDVEFADSIAMTSVGSLSQQDTVLVMLASTTEPAAVSVVDVVAESPTVVFSASHSTGSNVAYDVTDIVISPTEGLQAAAAPVMAVVETVLATIDMTASALLALLSGAGGGASPIAPVVQPIVDSSRVVIDPKRPRWALHNGVIEELAMYSLVVAPDQHFDLKDFGPAFRAADPVVRIEFVVPPQHGNVSATEIPGAFRYSADPGFSGVDSSRVVVTRSSGQVVAGAVTFVVNGRALPDRPVAPIRQVELPIRDQRLSDNGILLRSSTSAAIDASFGLSDGGMDLP